MDDKTQEAVEATLQQELLKNERIIEHPLYGTVHLHRPTASEETFIAEQRRKSSHRDMRDPDVLSRDELEKIAIQRGMWTEGLGERIHELSLKLGESMGRLDAIGFKSFEDLVKDYNGLLSELLGVFKDEPQVVDALGRYFDLDQPPTFADRTIIADNAPSSSIDDQLVEADTLRVQLDLLVEMGKVRKEYVALQEKQTSIFVDSIESRADRAESLARIFCCVRDAKGKKLWPSLDEMYNSDPDALSDLTLEYHYFVNGVTEEFKDTLGKFGFTKRQPNTEDSSDDSPGLPPSNSDGESVASAPTSSSEVTESLTAA